MTDPIRDLDGLMNAFGVSSVRDLEWAIEESADVDDGRDVFIDDRDDEVHVGIGTRGIQIIFPTDRASVLALVADVEQLIDPVPFHIVPGSAESTVIIHVPHSSRLIPEDVRASIMLDDAALERELDAMTDAFTGVIAERAAELCHVRPWLFVNGLSRLVVDPERFLDEREEMNAVGMGAVYTRTSDGFVLRDPSNDEISGLVDRFFTPYAEALSDLVDERLAAVGEVTIIDLHSFPLTALPYEQHGDGPRPEICLGTDPFHTPHALHDAARAALIGAIPSGEIGDDSPFSGCYVPLKHYQSNDRLSALMIELRRDLYMNDMFGLIRSTLDPLAAGIARLVDSIEQQGSSFALNYDVSSLLETFDAETLKHLATLLDQEVHPLGDATFRFVEGDGRLTLWLNGTGREVAFPISRFDLVDLADHVRHMGQESS